MEYDRINNLQLLMCQADYIADNIFNSIADGSLYKKVNTLDLMSGHTGIIIFLAYYLQDKKHLTEKNSQLFNNYIDYYITNIGNEVKHYSFGGGIAGIIYGLRFLVKNNLIDIDFQDLEIYYRNYLLSVMNNAFGHENYDFLHGALGISLVFADDIEFANNTIDWLNKGADFIDNRVRWSIYINETIGVGYNISLSHGYSSFLVILCRLYEAHKHNESLKRKIEILANKICNYILSQQYKIDCQFHISLFPSHSLENKEFDNYSRMAWCYGDLGIGAALWQAGIMFNNARWQAKAVEIYNYSTHRTSREDTLVVDASVCHGSAGIAIMFQWMYNQTKDFNYIKSRDYWINDMLNYSIYTDGIGGYKFFLSKDPKQSNPEWLNNYSFLNGISGVGLVILSILRNNDFHWSELLLLK